MISGKTQPIIISDLGKSMSEVNIKVLKSQLRSFKRTDMSCLLKLGILFLINIAFEFFFLYFLCLYPELRIVKS